MSAKHPLILLGPLPIDLINRTLATELEPGDAILTAVAHRHIAKDHSGDYALVIANLRLVISQPTYIGQSPNHGAAFEMVRRLAVPGGDESSLAAVNMIRNDFGNYNVHSAYRLTEEKVTARIIRKHLLSTKRKAPG